MGFGVWGLGLRVSGFQGSGLRFIGFRAYRVYRAYRAYRVYGGLGFIRLMGLIGFIGLKVSDLGFRVYRVWGLDSFGVSLQGFGFWVLAP